MRRSQWLLLLIIVAAGVLTAAAMRRTSTTFDEILLPSAGARGYVTGKFDLVTDHPPLLQYVYGLPVYLAGAQYPSETTMQWRYGIRYSYARAFFWEAGNDPERIAFLARMVAVLMAAGVTILTYAYARRHFGDAVAVVAAGLVAFTPDMLAHGGITYNDVPLALAYFGAAWIIDRALRDPTWLRICLAAVAAMVAVGVKFSGVALAPLTLVLLAAEWLRRGRDPRWLGRIALALPVALVVAYLALVAIYLGEFSLASFREGFIFNVDHAQRGHGAPAVLLGRYSVTGFWYYFPVAFVLKTPAGFHFLAFAALLGLVAAWRAAHAGSAEASPWRAAHAGSAEASPWRERLRRAAASPLRVPLLASAVFLALSMSANLNIGIRHALPVLPGFCILVALGVVHAWRAFGRLLRGAIAAAAAAFVLSSAAAYPNFIGYLTDYVGERGRFSVLVDSSYDWGQGLLALRDYMEEQGIESVYLSYFGSALPEGYGIRYVPLPSFFPLMRQPQPPGGMPRHIAISATNLAGNYVGDRFLRFRELEPKAVLMGSIYLYELADAPAPARAPAR